MNGRPVPVVIIGAGPTGMATATLLAQYGVESLVLERWESIYPQPRAVHLDDEIYRILARLGVAEEFAAVSRPCRGLRLVDRSLRVLAEFGRQARGRHGYPEASMFDQPELESLLRANVRRHPVARIRGNTEVTGLAQDGAGLVRVECTDRVDGGHHCILAHYVLGCDGANSMTRHWIGATMQDLRFAQRWLVADVATKTDLGQWEGVQQVCDPHRAATYMRLSTTHHRWEFRLLPGETADDYRQIEGLHRLLATWPGHRSRPAADDAGGRVHLPRPGRRPVAGPAGVPARRRGPSHPAVHRTGDGRRDAQRHEPGVEARRRPSRRPARRRARDLPGRTRAARPDHDPTGQADGNRHDRRWRSGLAGPPRGGVPVAAPVRAPTADLGQCDRNTAPGPLRPRRAAPLRRTLAGRLCPNARLDDGHRFDDVAAGRFAVVTSIDPSAAQRACVNQRGGVLIVTRPGSELGRWLCRGRSTAAIVRPDATVLRAGRDLSALCAALPASSARGAAPVSTL